MVITTSHIVGHAYIYTLRMRTREGQRTLFVSVAVKLEKMRVELIVLMLFVCMTVGEFFFNLFK